MASLPRSWDHGKILARLPRNLPWILARMPWFRTLGNHYSKSSSSFKLIGLPLVNQDSQRNVYSLVEIFCKIPPIIFVRSCKKMHYLVQDSHKICKFQLKTIRKFHKFLTKWHRLTLRKVSAAYQLKYRKAINGTNLSCTENLHFGEN